VDLVSSFPTLPYEISRNNYCLDTIELVFVMLELRPNKLNISLNPAKLCSVAS
jgi:hypothetical protein